MKPLQKTCDGCGKLRIIWKNVSEPDGRKRYCKSCWSCQNPGVKPTASTPLRPRSHKRQKQEQQYSKQRIVFLENNPYCNITIVGICTHKSTEVHHVDGRIEEDLTDEEGWKATCRKCHCWVHEHPRDARELGHLT